MFFMFLARILNFIQLNVIYYSNSKHFLCIILDYKNLKFKQLINDIAIDLWSSKNFTSIKDIRIKCNLGYVRIRRLLWAFHVCVLMGVGPMATVAARTRKKSQLKCKMKCNTHRFIKTSVRVQVLHWLEHKTQNVLHYTILFTSLWPTKQKHKMVCSLQRLFFSILPDRKSVV